jgi:iron complex transport system substrate-binding protein
VRPALLLIVMATTLGLLSAGCGQRSEPTGELEQPYPVTVQGAGDRQVELESSPQRIVALDAGSAELLDALGAGKRLVGAPAGVRLADKRKAAPVVKQNGQIDVDRVDKLKPDLIVVASDTDPVDVAQAERRTGAAVYVQPSRTVEDVERAVLELGFLIGQPVEARQLAGSIERSLAETEERLAGVEPVSTFVDQGFFVTVSNRSLLGDLVRRAHGTNVAGDYAGLGPFPVARLRKADPDVYLATSDSDVTLATLEKDPQTRELGAVVDGRVVVVPTDLVTRAGPRIAKALETVAAALHPDAFQ